MKHYDSSDQTSPNIKHTAKHYSAGAILCGIVCLLIGYWSSTKGFMLVVRQYLAPAIKTPAPFNNYASGVRVVLQTINTILPPSALNVALLLLAIVITIMWSTVYFLLGTAVFSLVSQGSWRKGTALAIVLNIVVLLLEPSLRSIGFGNTFLFALLIPILALLNFYLNQDDPLSRRAFLFMYTWSMLACNLVSVATTTTNVNLVINALLSLSLFLTYRLL